MQWQDDRDASHDSFAICILGRDPFGTTLDSTVEGESLDGRKITVRRLASNQAATQCDILFISSSEQGRLPAILAAVRHQPTLTVSDMPHFAERGGMIGFVMQKDRIRFEVNRRPAEESHILLSSELLKVATKVIDKGATEP